MNNVLLVHGGGPTSVINASLVGVVKAAKKLVLNGEIHKILGAKNGTGGILMEQFVDLGNLSDDDLSIICNTPGSVIGTSRDPLDKDDYDKMAGLLVKNDIKYVLFNGGNGTMDTCGKLNQACRENGYSINVIGIPKTIDNDIFVTDHSPGYGSAARYMAQSVREICADVNAMPIHVVIVETFGRNTGWIAASSALAASEHGEKNNCQGPDLIYLPEIPFDKNIFLEDIRRLLTHKKGIVVVVSEGIKDKNGCQIVEPILKVGRATYFGDVGSYLANLVIKELGYKARSEKPGILGRCSVAQQSSVDVREAEMVGEIAFSAAYSGESGKMVAFRRISDEPYKIEAFLVELEKVMLLEKRMPAEFINEDGNGVTDKFKQWCRPLLGGALTDMISLN